MNAGRKVARGVLLAALLAGLGAAGWWGYHAHQRRRALALASAGDFAEAAPLLARRLARSPDDLEVARALASGHLDAKEPEAALPALDAWCRLRPDDPEPYRLRMRAFGDMQRYPEALPDGLRVLELTQDEGVETQVAGIAFSAGDFATAERLCRGVTKREPGRRDVRRLLAQTLIARGETAEAAGLLEALLREKADDPAALMARGVLALNAGDAALAVKLLEEVVRIDPRRWRTGRYHLSLAYERAGRPEDARRVAAEVAKMQDAETLKLALPTRPDDLDLRVRTAEALMAAGSTKEALDLLGEVLRRDPAFKPAHAALARHYERLGDKGLARKHRERAE